MKSFLDWLESEKMKKIMQEKEKISEIAYALWQEAGCPENKDLDFWLIAEKKYKLLQTFDNEKKEEESVKFSRLTIPLIRRIYPMIMYGKK